MPGKVILFDPTAPHEDSGLKQNQTLDRLAGKVVGFIDNAKPNFNYLVEDLSDLLVSRYGVSRVVTRKKRAASVPAPEAMMKEIADQCDVVIAGSGD